MAHTTFYRKYRSQTFTELEGQDHIIQTLSNAITLDRLSHAYIFSGPRGTGKTSTARILAKALNCRHAASITPCLVCDQCQKITLGQAVDVLEIDAASNTGVDNIRTLNEQVNFTPIEGRYKIYIIDEVHMLSTGAFNALLKTLEEPPVKTIFILATTEPQKIPMTIHSRCQHLQFRKLTISELVTNLTKIAQAEDISITPGSMNLIARQSAGCMRDAVSLLDQVYSFKGNTISEADVIDLLGGSTFDSSCQLMVSFFKKDPADVVSQLRKFFLEGGNVHQLVSDLSAITKQLMYMFLKLDKEVDLDQARKEHLKTLMQGTSFTDIASLLENFAKLEMDIRWFPNPELLIEIRFLTWLNLTQAITAPAQPQVVATIQTKTPLPPTPASQISTPVAAPTPSIVSPTLPTPAQAPQTRVFGPQIVAQVPSSVTPTVAPSVSAPIAPISQIQNTESETINRGAIESKWTSFLQELKAKRPPLFSILDRSQVLGVSGNTIEIRLKQDFKFFRDKINEETHKSLINQILMELFNTKLELSFEISPQSPAVSTPQPSDVTSSSEIQVPNEPITIPQPTKVQPNIEQDSASQPQKINEIVALFEGKLS